MVLVLRIFIHFSPLVPCSFTRQMATFQSVGLHEWLTKACREMGFQKPTLVQEKCIPAILSGQNCIASAETGSGKTAAFALPILHTLSEDPYGIFALVLTPTRYTIAYHPIPTISRSHIQ
jgi:superfamily II DNA/RNA helicase